MQLFCAVAKKIFFRLQKFEKTTLKSYSDKLKSTFLPLPTFFPSLPGLPKQPKQMNSCSKMWFKEQL